MVDRKKIICIIFVPFNTSMQYSLRKKFIVYIMPLAAILVSCGTYYQPASVAYEKVQVKPDAGTSKDMQQLLEPYSATVGQSMKKVIGQMGEVHEKALPQSRLGNLMTDAVKAEATRLYGVPVDVAFINYGGIRVNQMLPGNVHLGNVYELMPFDNLLIIQRLPGNVFKEMMDNIAKRGGWPASGITYTIKDKKATDILIGGQPFDASKTYVVANSDYVANGGDDMEMLRTIKQENKGYLVRDALIKYFSAFAERGEKINGPAETRVKYAD